MHRIELLDWRKAAFAAVMGLSFLGLIKSLYFPLEAGSYHLDFRVYYCAARMVYLDRHAPIYDGALDRIPVDVEAPRQSAIALRGEADGVPPPVMLYIYPPLLADLLSPLARLHYDAAGSAWRALNLVLLYGSLIAVAGLARIRILSADFAVLVLAILCFRPMLDTQYLGQLNIVLFALWAFGILAYDRGRTVLSAALIALATALKVTPLGVVPLFLVWRDRRWLTSYFVALASLIGAMAIYNGPASLAQFFTVASAMTGGVPIPENQSIPSLIAWLAFGRTFDHVSVRTILPFHSPALSLIIRLAELAFYGSCLLLVSRRRQAKRSERAAVLALFAVIVVLVAPVSWVASYTVAFIPLTLEWAGWLHRLGRWSRGILLAGTSVLFQLADSIIWWSQRMKIPPIVGIVFAASMILVTAAFCLVGLTAFSQSSRAQLTISD